MQTKQLKRQSQIEDPINHHATQSTQWQQIKTSSTTIGRRCCHASCLHNDNLYIYGGYDNNSPGIFSDMYAYSFKDGSWRGIEQDGDLPGQRHSHTAVTYGDALFMFGGMTNAMNNTNFLHRFDFNMSQWKKLPTSHAPLPIDSHKACIYKDRMIVGLGYSQNQYNSKIYEFNIAKMQWKCIFNPKNCKSNQYPNARAHGSFNVFDNGIFIYGGKDFRCIFDDFWRFDLQTNKFSKIELVNPIPGRFSHSGVIYDKKLFIFGGTKGVTHEKNDLISIDLENGVIHTCWIDSQEERLKVKEENNPIIKKSRRDSVKKFGIEFYDNENSEVEKSNQSPAKYRNQLREVNYYNELYENHKKQNEGSKKTRRNPLLTQLEGSQENQSLNLTSTFEILTNSIMLTMGKSPSKQQKSELNYDSYKRVPKSRDNYSADLLQNGDNARLIIFGGGMHKISYNDIILIDLTSIIKRSAH